MFHEWYLIAEDRLPEHPVLWNGSEEVWIVFLVGEDGSLRTVGDDGHVEVLGHSGDGFNGVGAGGAHEPDLKEGRCRRYDTEDIRESKLPMA